MTRSTLALLLFFIGTVNAQIPCQRLPDSTKLLADLTTRPVSGISPRVYRESCNVTPAMKGRILQVLQWEWSKEELDFYILQATDSAAIKRYSNTNRDTSGWDAQIAKFRTRLLEHMNKDGLFSVDVGLTLLPAKLYLREAIPILERALDDSLHYNRYAVKLALARFGNKKFQQEIIGACVTNPTLRDRQWLLDALNKLRPLLFVCTQGSIYQFTEFLDTSKIFHRTSDNRGITKSATEVVWYLSKIILNADFKRKYDWEWLYNMLEINNEVILYCRDWLIKNKDRYELNKEYVLY